MVRAYSSLAAALLIMACAPMTGERANEVPAAGVPGGKLFVANKRGNSLSLIDLASGTETARVVSCANPHELAVSPDGNHVALACYGGTTVDVFRSSDLGKVASYDLGENARPHGIVWHSNGRIYATAEGRQEIVEIAALSYHAIPPPIRYATGKQGSHMLAVSPDARTAWTTDLGSRTVTRIDLVTRRAPLSVTVGEEPEGISLSPDGATLWVSARRSDKAFGVDPVTMEVRSETATGRFPLRIAVRPQGDFAVTSDLADGSLSVIDTATARLVRTIAVSGAAEAERRQQVTVLWSADGKRIYVAETGTDTVAEVDFAAGTVVRRFAVGAGGDGLAVVTVTD